MERLTIDGRRIRRETCYLKLRESQGTGMLLKLWPRGQATERAPYFDDVGNQQTNEEPNAFSSTTSRSPCPLSSVLIDVAMSSKPLGVSVQYVTWVWRLNRSPPWTTPSITTHFLDCSLTSLSTLRILTPSSLCSVHCSLPRANPEMTRAKPIKQLFRLPPKLPPATSWP